MTFELSKLVHLSSNVYYTRLHNLVKSGWRREQEADNLSFGFKNACKNAVAAFQRYLLSLTAPIGLSLGNSFKWRRFSPASSYMQNCTQKALLMSDVSDPLQYAFYGCTFDEISRFIDVLNQSRSMLYMLLSSYFSHMYALEKVFVVNIVKDM